MQRPPRKWFKEMLEDVGKQYSNFSAGRKARVVAGIWYKKLTSKQRAAIVRKYGDADALKRLAAKAGKA